ncbi:MAG: DNA-binding protein [Clostridiales bacterium]|nr:DNA-binding protein [Clostridiales bacterium]MDO5140492.1 DNA-binding protein [Eubacteriales bacterium]
MKYAKGSFKAIWAVRMEPGEDVQETLLEFCRKNNIGHAVVLSCIGSLKGCSFFDPGPIPGKPGLYAYGAPIEYPEPIEFISMTGHIGTEDDGSISGHLHAAFADEKGNCFAGHFKEGNRVLTTVELILGEIDGINMHRHSDGLRGVKLWEPEQL